MAQGYLKADVTTAQGAVPIPNATVKLRINGQIVDTLYTDESGQAMFRPIITPDKSADLASSSNGPYSTPVTVEVSAPGYASAVVNGVEIFDGETAALPVNLQPSRDAAAVNEIILGSNSLHSSQPRSQTTNYQELENSRILKDVIIPENITVHLGSYSNLKAKNVTVPFVDYLKNVASSEIYPNWPYESLKANVLAQITFALNRIYTEWYPSRGYNFDITNNTAQDQYYREGGPVYDSVSKVVDEVYGEYVRRQGFKEPYFTEYCNGTTATCPGMSQWGTVDRANEGMDALQILRYYYPKDIQIATSNRIEPIQESYPGYELKNGTSGDAVKVIQAQLNRIRANYPAIPLIANVDGIYGPQTVAAVKKFQEIFGLTADGITGKTTWNKISYIYTAVKKLAELTSEGERIGIGASPPSSVLRTGSQGQDVVELQYILMFLRNFYPEIPNLSESGTFDSLTNEAVKAFQWMAGLTQDGIVGPTTWERLYEYYHTVQNSVPNLPDVGADVYPGYIIKNGVSGTDVQKMQRYLNAIGEKYPSIPQISTDGVFGPATKKAVEAFQNLFGLTADGIIGRITWNKIVEIYRQAMPTYPGTPLKVGSRGKDVLVMQEYLRVLSQRYPDIPTILPDGIFGNGTAAAVKAFQKLYGLTADGIIGPATWNAIANAYAQATSVYQMHGDDIAQLGDDLSGSAGQNIPYNLSPYAANGEMLQRVLDIGSGIAE